MAERDQDRDNLVGSKQAPGNESAFSADSPTVHLDPNQVPSSPASGPPPAQPDADATASRFPSLQPGDLLDDGRYRIARFLGQGGMGAVYEAEDLELGERVALKTLRPETSVPDALERFKREINVARRVTHPAVCRLYDLGRHRTPDGRDLLFLTMQFLEGETLRERIKKKGPMSPAETLPLARQMAEGLDAAHSAGVIHRDFKSGNVMLVQGHERGKKGQLRAVITDFGLARDVLPASAQHESLTATAGFVGTPAYASPEQIQGLEVGPASDLYALGIVLYECLTGRLPFDDAPTAWMAVVRRLHEKPIPPRQHVPGLDARWEAAILQCLERRPEDRFGSGQELIDALVAPLSIQLTVPVATPPTPPGFPAEPGSPAFPTPPSSTPVSAPTGPWPTPASPTSSSPTPVTWQGSTPPTTTQGPPGTWPPGTWPPGTWPPGTWPPGTWPPGTPPAPGALGTSDTTPPTATGWMQATASSMPGWPPAPTAAPPKSKLRWIVVAVALLLVVALGFWIGRSSTDPETNISGEKRRTVAVLGLANLSRDAKWSWLSTALTEMLAMEVAAGDRLRVIPSEQISQIKTSLKLVETSSYTPETLQRVHQLLGSDLVVVGNFLASGETLRVTVQLQDAQSGQTLMQASENGTEKDLIRLVEKMGDQLRRGLGMAELTDAELARARRAFPDNAASARLYAEGLAYLHRYELNQARAKLEEAVAGAPDKALPYASLAEALWLTGNEEEARRKADRAVELSAELGPRERMAITARQREMHRDWPGAVAVLQELRRLYPEDIEYGLALGRVQNSAGELDASLATFAELRQLPAPAGDDPRIGVIEANNYLRKSQYDRALEVAEAAAATARARGARITEGAAHAYRAAAFRNKGELSQALDEFDRAGTVFREAGYPEGASAVLADSAQILSDLGDFKRAESNLDEAIRIQRAAGVTAKLRHSLSLRSVFYFQRGELARARRDAEECLKMPSSEVAQAEYRRQLAQISLNLGELSAAGADLSEVIAFATKAKHPRLLTMTQSHRGELHLVRGELDLAQRDFEEVLASYRQAGDQPSAASTEVSLAKVAAYRGATSEAMGKIDAALASRAGSLVDLRSFQMRTSWVELVLSLDIREEFPRARTEIEDLLATPQNRNLPPILMRNLIAGAELALRRGDGDTARRFAQEARELLGEVEVASVKMLAEILVSKAQALTGSRSDQAAAFSRLRAVQERAHRLGFALIEDEAELAIGEVEIAGLDPAAGRARMRSLSSRADELGRGSFAARARRLAAN